MCVCLEVVILERRNGAGKVLYKPVLSGWNGSEEDKHRLLEELQRLQKDPSILNHDAVLPELNNEFASVSASLPPPLASPAPGASQSPPEMEQQ